MVEVKTEGDAVELRLWNPCFWFVSLASMIGMGVLVEVGKCGSKVCFLLQDGKGRKCFMV